MSYAPPGYSVSLRASQQARYLTQATFTRAGNPDKPIPRRNSINIQDFHRRQSRSSVTASTSAAVLNARYHVNPYLPSHGDYSYAGPASQRLEDLEFQLALLEERPSHSISERNRLLQDVKDLRRELRMGQSSADSSEGVLRNTIERLEQEAKDADMQIRAAANIGPLTIRGQTVSPRCFVPCKVLSDVVGQLERILRALQDLSLVSVHHATNSRREKVVRFVTESIYLLDQAWQYGGVFPQPLKRL
ncbi:hypothetical protein EIP91_005380 [Steccherinum ochraceum]|uniref:Uncharacterized protein n=1 Tax=Steccherinum ochraceum TaxID=92696 RepID=A0A4R0R786_9APHY|nr:hypothetical protein EIP91_005380 [Steccherinum ochraceum]